RRLSTLVHPGLGASPRGSRRPSAVAHTLLGVHDSASQTVTSSTAAPDATPVPGPTVAPDAATVSDPTAPATGSSIPALRSIVARIAGELGVGERQVAAAVALLDGGATVPFIARYRKEVTGGLDDAQLRTLEERLVYLRELDERRTAIIESIRSQGKLTDQLLAQLMTADTKARLEDIYLPDEDPEWAAELGAGTEVNWPAGTIGGHGNEGVTANIAQNPGRRIRFGQLALAIALVVVGALGAAGLVVVVA